FRFGAHTLILASWHVSSIATVVSMAPTFGTRHCKRLPPAKTASDHFGSSTVFQGSPHPNPLPRRGEGNWRSPLIPLRRSGEGNHWPARGRTVRPFVRLILGAVPWKEVPMPTVIGSKWCRGLCLAALLAGLLAGPCRAGEVGEYLTKDGQLKEAITVRMGAVQFFAPAPEVWIIQPSGDWVWQATDSKGKLSSKQLAALAQHFATQDFNSLPQTQGYDQKNGNSGYEYVVIAFGKKEATFYTKPGESPC